MNEEEKIGGFGIDTQYERDKINYRPKIEYNNPNIVSGVLSVDTDGQQSNLQEVDRPIAVDTWGKAVDIINELDTVEKQLSEKLKDVSSNVPNKYLDAVREAAKKFGEDIDNTISFGLYKATFKYPDSREAVLIQDIYEEYQSDVNGSLNAELYVDVVEMQNDWADMTDFIKKGLLLQLVSEKDLPTTISDEDTSLDQIHVTEQQMIDDYQQSLKTDEVNGDRWRELLIENFESNEYFEAMKLHQDGERKTKQMEKKIDAIAEIGDLVDSKALNASKAINLIKGTIDFVPYESEEYDILYHLLKQYSDKQSLMGGLSKIQAIIKLSVDNKNMKVNETKENLKGIAGRTIKKKINNSLVNGVHLRNGVSMSVHDLLENFDGVPDSKAFEIVANHIATGLDQANTIYMDQSSDFYKAHMMDAELRMQKLRGLVDKDASRQVYKILGQVVGHVETVGKWADDTELSTWLNAFMEQNN